MLVRPCPLSLTISPNPDSTQQVPSLPSAAAQKPCPSSEAVGDLSAFKGSSLTYCCALCCGLSKTHLSLFENTSLPWSEEKQRCGMYSTSHGFPLEGTVHCGPPFWWVSPVIPTVWMNQLLPITALFLENHIWFKRNVEVTYSKNRSPLSVALIVLNSQN